MAVQYGQLSKWATFSLLEERGLAVCAEFDAQLPLNPFRLDEPEELAKVARHDVTVHELALVGSAIDSLQPDRSLPKELRWVNGARYVMKQHSPGMQNIMLLSDDNRDDQAEIFREMDEMTLPEGKALVKDEEYARGVALGEITLKQTLASSQEELFYSSRHYSSSLGLFKYMVKGRRKRYNHHKP